MPNPITLLTLVHARQQALINQLRGISMCSKWPIEVIVVHMNEEISALPSFPFPVRQLSLFRNDGLNLAAARNYAMRHSTTPNNIFLDVDCIPAPELIAEYEEALSGSKNLVSGRVRYLSSDETSSLNLSSNLFEHSTPDPVRPENINFTHELFWTLNFGCTKSIFSSIGGFDEAYSGYGAEDTDFAFMARQKNIGLRTIDATAFHQYHPSYSPPLNHIQQILRNAKVFYEKWKTWPMDGWLKAFEELGFIKWLPTGPELLRQPTADEVGRALKL